ncbi:MAG TPA: asparaginase [Mycobacteriales bacterium]|jgi:L-asparaginase|nr:asparaginase [Mycobacteriales bacterium]
MTGSSSRVVVYGLGGTISMGAAGPGGVVPSLSPADLMAAVPGLDRTGIELEVVDLRRLPGASVGFADVAAVLAALPDSFGAGATGAVVIQGTDTIEETAYLLDLLHPGPQPVVVTGAMRNPTLAGADGPANLLAAVQVAAGPAAVGLGALVVFADEIHAARRVRKTNTTSIGTFRSPDTGPLGHVVEGRPVLLSRPGRRTVVPAGDRPARVALVTMAFDDDGVLLDGLAGRVDGLVLAALGAGHVPERLVPVLTELAAGMPVVLASRTGSGSVVASTYAFAGSESDLLGRGLIRAGFLDPFKARLLLHTLLAAGADDATIRAAFGAAGGYADTWPYR